MRIPAVRAHCARPAGLSLLGQFHRTERATENSPEQQAGVPAYSGVLRRG